MKTGCVTIRRTIITAGMAVVFLVGCESAEKYQKRPAEPAITGEVELRLGPELRDWAKELSGALDAARLAVDLGDTSRGMALADSLIGVAEVVLDTVPDRSPIQKFLLLFVSDAYGRSIVWAQGHGDGAKAAALTSRFTALAARLKARHDSLRDTTARLR